MVMVKANAYGHGIQKISRELLNAGAHYIGVAYLEEALFLRQNGSPTRQADHVTSLAFCFGEQVVKGAGSIKTTRGFGDCQLHVEWASPAPAAGSGQDRGNSGVFLMGTYEVQVLDSYDSKTYADGSAAAIYGQYPPLVNASRKPGEWQTYDIVFTAPRFDADGAVVSPAFLTVFHNGVLVQDREQLTGPTAHKARPPHKAHADRLPILLQDHSHPVRFRNIWVRELGTK